MFQFLNCGVLKCSPFFLLILLQSCTSVPEADFYEVDGIVSIRSEDLSDYQGWELIADKSTVSLISKSVSPDEISPLVFPFYIRETGNYTLWILGNRDHHGSDRDYIILSLLDGDENQLFQTLLNFESAPLLTWMSRDIDDRSISFQIDRPGHYQINIRSMGMEGYLIHKIHLTLNNEHPPSGTGLPVTSDPFLDPLLLKREQRVELPKAQVFGPVFEGYKDEISSMDEIHIIREYGVDEDEIRGLEKSPDFGQYDIMDLKTNIEMVANPRLITFELPFTFYPLGGFNYKETPSFKEEKLIRWAQFSTFSSVMHLFPEESYSQLEGDGLISQESLNHIEDLTRLRRSLFPYIYSEYHLMRGTGIKPIGGNSENPTQFMFGDSFLSAPIYELEAEERFVYLPSGIWYDYFTGTRYEGGQSWLIEAPLHRIPVFVKAGSIIPYRVESESMYPAHYDSLLIEIYGGSVGTFRLYEDDGLSMRYKQGQFSTTAFRYFERDDYATFTIGRMVREFEWQSSEKRLTLNFKHLQKPVSVIANEEELMEGEGLKEWFYDNRGMLVIQWIQPNHIKTDFEIRF